MTPAQSLRVTWAPGKSHWLQLQNLPVAHHLHIHWAGMSHRHLSPRPVQSPQPHRLPCFRIHTPRPVHIWPPSHTRPLFGSDSFPALSGIQDTVHIMANKVLWDLASHCFPDQSPVTVASLLGLKNSHTVSCPRTFGLTVCSAWKLFS